MKSYNMIGILFLSSLISASLQSGQLNAEYTYITIPLFKTTNITDVNPILNKITDLMKNYSGSVKLKSYINPDTLLRETMHAQALIQYIERQISVSSPYINIIHTEIENVYEYKQLPAWKPLYNIYPCALVSIILQTSL